MIWDFLIGSLDSWGIFSISVKNAIGILIRVTLNLLIALGIMDILTILILLISEHGISFHLFGLLFFFEFTMITFII